MTIVIVSFKTSTFWFLLFDNNFAMDIFIVVLFSAYVKSLKCAL